ncbi:hypothetical protein N7528_010005 [Penicillium herquei]|nr:hypothetical protein N7528_010005 [Penicillium herquei]
MQVAEFILDESRWPADLLEEINRAHDLAAQNIASQDRLLAVFIVAHERKMVSEDSEFIIEGVYSSLERANRKTMEIFQSTYPDYPSSSFYAQGVWQSIGPDSVGWYVSRNGTLALEIVDEGGNECRVYAEMHAVE